MKYTTLLFGSFIILISGVAACRKKSSSSPTAPAPPAKFTGCRISQISELGAGETTATIYKFTYNDDGTVAKISFLQ